MSEEEDLEELAELENGIEVDLDDGEEHSSNNMNDDWDNVVDCSGSEEEH
ncbi:hypothetical protein LINPERHAP2_LOCUS34939 [Linum perenne]